MKQEHKKHLQFLYYRLVNVHKEDECLIIMKDFKWVIDNTTYPDNFTFWTLKCVQNRLINIHGENQNYDYMLNLSQIIVEVHNALQTPIPHTETAVSVEGSNAFTDSISPSKTGKLSGVTKLDSPKDYGHDSSCCISGNVNMPLEQRVFESVKKDIIRNDDGYYVFYPKKTGGYYEPHQLRIIADYLDKINKPWDDHIDKHFDSFKDEPNINDDERVVRGTMTVQPLIDKQNEPSTPWEWYVSYLINRRNRIVF